MSGNDTAIPLKRDRVDSGYFIFFLQESFDAITADTYLNSSYYQNQQMNYFWKTMS